GVVLLVAILVVGLRGSRPSASGAVAATDPAKTRADGRRHVVVGEVKFPAAIGEEAAAFRDEMIRIIRGRGAEVGPVKHWHEAGGKSSWASLSGEVDREMLAHAGSAADTDAIVTAEIAPGGGTDTEWIFTVRILKTNGGRDRDIVIRHSRPEWGLL